MAATLLVPSRSTGMCVACTIPFLHALHAEQQRRLCPSQTSTHTRSCIFPVDVSDGVSSSSGSHSFPSFPGARFGVPFYFSFFFFLFFPFRSLSFSFFFPASPLSEFPRFVFRVSWEEEGGSGTVAVDGGGWVGGVWGGPRRPVSLEFERPVCTRGERMDGWRGWRDGR